MSHSPPLYLLLLLTRIFYPWISKMKYPLSTSQPLGFCNLCIFNLIVHRDFEINYFMVEFLSSIINHIVLLELYDIESTLISELMIYTKEFILDSKWFITFEVLYGFVYSFISQKLWYWHPYWLYMSHTLYFPIYKLNIWWHCWLQDYFLVS